MNGQRVIHVSSTKKPEIIPLVLGVVTAAIGASLMMSGVLLFLFFYLAYDTAPHGTHNMGLLQNQLIGALEGMLCAILGGFLFIKKW